MPTMRTGTPRLRALPRPARPCRPAPRLRAPPAPVAWAPSLRLPRSHAIPAACAPRAPVPHLQRAPRAPFACLPCAPRARSACLPCAPRARSAYLLLARLPAPARLLPQRPNTHAYAPQSPRLCLLRAQCAPAPTACAPPGRIVAWLGTVSQYNPALPLLHNRNTLSD